MKLAWVASVLIRTACILAMRKLEQEQKLNEAVPLSPHHPLLCQVFALAPIYAWPESREALCMGTLATQANGVISHSLLPLKNINTYLRIVMNGLY